MEAYWAAVLAWITVAWGVMLTRTRRRWHAALEETCDLRAKLRDAESSLRITKLKLSIEEKIVAGLRENVHTWRERYHELWAETHLGDIEHGESEDDGRS